MAFCRGENLETRVEVGPLKRSGVVGPLSERSGVLLAPLRGWGSLLV